MANCSSCTIAARGEAREFDDPNRSLMYFESNIYNIRRTLISPTRRRRREYIRVCHAMCRAARAFDL